MPEMPRRPEVVREKISHLGRGRVACALIFDREFSPGEVSRFYAMRTGGAPTAGDFELAGRVLGYECDEDDEARWRLAAEILLVKCFRRRSIRRPADPASPRPAGPSDR